MANIELTQTISNSTWLVAVVVTAVTSILYLENQTKALRGRYCCLMAAQQATREFYDTAERLLRDPAITPQLKDWVYGLTLAVTDEDAGEIALEALLGYMSESESKRSSAPDSVISDLNALRQHRGDLYDDFGNAMRAAMSSLILSHGQDNSKVVVEFQATRNQSMLLALASRLARALESWTAGGRDGGGATDAQRA